MTILKRPAQLFSDYWKNGSGVFVGLYSTYKVQHFGIRGLTLKTCCSMTVQVRLPISWSYLLTMMLISLNYFLGPAYITVLFVVLWVAIPTFLPVGIFRVPF